ncbi:MAG: hypothetical protein AAGF28_00760 [Pseudomonadota bacterium]
MDDRKTDSQKRKRFRRSRKNYLTDFSLGIAGVCLAVASAYLPWHIHKNPDSFSPPRMAFTGQLDADSAIPDLPVAQVQPRSQFGVLNINDLDLTVTGSIEPRQPVREIQLPSPSNQSRSKPTPKDGYTVIFASAGTALISDGRDVFPVSSGSKLPDGSTVVRISRTNNGWSVATSDNASLIWNP